MALTLGSGTGAFAQFAGQGGWDAPPQESNDVARRGFHDGIEGARKDYENHRQPNVNNRDEYRHPNVPRRDRNDYRAGFQRGYDAGVQHLVHDGPR
jgi:ribosome modulation factor